MNAVSIASNMIEFTANSKAALLAVTLAFGMLCVYRMVTGNDWFAKVLGVMLLVTAVVVLAGCVPVDPMRSAQATERTNQSAIAVNQSAAQIAAGQQSAEDARRAQERIEALQLQQAIVNGQQGIAEANARQGIAESNNATLVNIAAQMAEASKPDYTPFIILLIVSMCMTPLFVLLAIRSHQAQTPQAVVMTQLPTMTRAALPEPSYSFQIPDQVQAHAARLGGVPEWSGDRWVIIEPNSRRVLATQRTSSKLLRDKPKRLFVAKSLTLATNNQSAQDSNL